MDNDSTFLQKCKGAAIILTAVTGLALGILNHFKETRDPRLKPGYQELGDQVVLLSKDIQRLSQELIHHQEEIGMLQQLVLYSLGETKGSHAVKAMAEVRRVQKKGKVLVMPPARKPRPLQD